MNEKLNKISGGIFFSILLIGSIIQIIMNTVNYDSLPFFWQGGFLIAIVAPIAVAVISIRKLYDYLTIEKLEKDLRMEE